MLMLTDCPKACPNIELLITNDLNWVAAPLTDSGFLSLVTSLPKLRHLEIGHGRLDNPGHRLTRHIITQCYWDLNATSRTARNHRNDHSSTATNRWVCKDLNHLSIPRAELPIVCAKQLLAAALCF